MAEDNDLPQESKTEFDVKGITSYWLVEAREALSVADHLVEKADYSYALFFGHLAIEKILKALCAAKNHEHAPPTHHLLRLARTANLKLEEKHSESLITITAFNIEARYPDMKRMFRQRCTPEYTVEQLTKIKELFQWLMSQMQ